MGYYRGADKSLARPTSRCILFDVENIRLMLVFLCVYIYIHIYIYIYIYTGCHRRNGPNFGRVFLMLNYTDRTVTEIMARKKCGHLAFPRNVRLQLCSALTVRL